MKKVTFTNAEIIELAAVLINGLPEEVVLPAKAMYYVARNSGKIVTIARELDSARTAILARYGTLDEEKQQYVVPKENVEQAQAELTDLLTLTEDIDLYGIDLEWLDGVKLSNQQFKAIEPMILDPEVE